MKTIYRILSLFLLIGLISSCKGGANQATSNKQINLSAIGRKTVAGWTYGNIKEIKEIEYRHGLGGGPSNQRDFDAYRSTGDLKYLFPWNNDYITENVYTFNPDSSVTLKHHNTKGRNDLEEMWEETYSKDGLLLVKINYDVYDKGSLEADKTTFIYNGLSFKGTTYNNDGDKKSETTGTIDESYNILTKKTSIGDYVYKYDNNKCLKEQRLTYTGSLVLNDDEIIRFQYNEKGFVVSEKTYRYKVSSGIEKLSTDYCFEYDYDEQGNWVAKYLMTDSGHILNYTKREISYEQ